MVERDNEKSREQEVERLESRIQQLESLVSELLTQQTMAASAPQQGSDGDDIDTYYPNVEAFVTKEVAPTYSRAIGGEFRWCVQWWDHPEAVSRLEALWRAWERMRLDPAFGMAHFYRDYWDIGFPAVYGPRGPFARCSPERHEPARPLPCQPAPEGTLSWGSDDDPDPFSPKSGSGNPLINFNDFNAFGMAGNSGFSADSFSNAQQSAPSSQWGEPVDSWGDSEK